MWLSTLFLDVACRPIRLGMLNWSGEVRCAPAHDGLRGQRFDVERLVEYVELAAALGFDAVAVNDHVVFEVPWLDGPTALAAVVSCSGRAQLFTTVVNPVVRGPAALAKILAGLDVMSGGRVVAGLGPGSSERDYASVGLAFDERRPRFEESVKAIRALLRGESFRGPRRDHRCAGAPADATRRPPLWIGSWGSEVGLRRAVRLGRRIRERARDDVVPHRRTSSRHHRRGRACPAVRRPVEELRGRLPFCSAEVVADELHAFRAAGVQRVFLWPVADELEQLTRFAAEVIPRLDA